MPPPPQPAATGPVEAAVCSAKGCRRTASWAVLWNNPKLHDPARRKVWTACTEHRESLGQFLELRGFLKDVVPLEALSEPESPSTQPLSRPEEE